MKKKLSLGLFWIQILREEGQYLPLGAGGQKAHQAAQGANEMLLSGNKSIYTLQSTLHFIA